MSQQRLFVFTLIFASLILPAAALGQPGCDRYDDGSPRPASDPNPDVACGGTGSPPPEALQTISGSLTTLFASNNQFAGNTFDIVPDVDIMITSFDVNLNGGSATTITIYWRNGTALGNESTSAGWMAIGSDTVNPNGIDIPTPVAIGGLTLTAGNTYGFYVDTQSYPSAALRYTDGGPTMFANADLTLTTFYGKGNPAFSGMSFFPRQWNGTVYYDILDAAVPTPTLSHVGLACLLLVLAAVAFGVRPSRRTRWS